MKRIPKLYLLSLTVLLLLIGQILVSAANLTFNSFFYTEAQVSSGTWTKITDLADPQTRRSMGWAYDSIHNVIVMFGGVGNSSGSTGQTWIYHLDTQTWERKFPAMSPPSRSVHSMTFDSDNGLVVLFGGYRTSHSDELNDTWVYDYEANTWRQLVTPVSPEDRHWPGLAYDPVAKKVVLFGGHDKFELVVNEQRSDTWLLDVDAETWTQVFPANHPSGRQTSLMYNPSDGLIYAFGGKYEVDVGGPEYDVQFYNDLWSYNVSTNTWTVIHGNFSDTNPSYPEPRRSKLAYDPANNLMMLFGGEGPFDPSIPGFRAYGDTWSFDFNTMSWTEINTAASPQARFRHMTVYDPINEKLLVYGGTPKLPESIGDFWEFQVAEPVQTITVNAGLDQTVQVGTPALFFGSYSFGGTLVNPVAEWKFGDGTIVSGSIPDALQQSHTYSTAQTYTVTLTITDDNGNYGKDTLVVTVTPTSDSEPAWLSFDSGATLSKREEHTAVWTGTEMIIWGGFADGIFFNSGAKYNPDTDTWTATSMTGVPTARKFHTAVWIGDKMIVWGGRFLDTGGIYDPSTNTWAATSTTGAPAARSFHTGVWTGDKMIVWGGSTSPGVTTNTGGIYDPSTNTWATINTSGAPSGRQDHTAVWTGSRMIVWGGSSGGTYLNEGGVYDPSADSWSPLSLVDAPSGRTFHTAVWTGDKMIVWGGITSSGRTNTGGAYDPVSNTWNPLPTSGAPTSRDGHTAVWTGTEMIIWGGFDTSRTNTGGRYDPESNTWNDATPTTNAPAGRTAHTAIWADNEMIVWGGILTPPPDAEETNTGGRLINLYGDGVPVANDQEVFTEKDTAVLIMLTGSDPEGDTLTYYITSDPSYGTLSGFSSATGEVTYTPSSGYNGPDSFFFKVSDGTSDSNLAIVSITVEDTPTHATTLALDPITSVGWSRPVTITGTLTDNDASGAGIGGKTITFSGTGATGLPSSPVVTNSDGTFSVTGTAPATVASGWTVQAHFSGDPGYLTADSNVRSYSTLKHRIVLFVSAKDLPWGQPTSFIATLRDGTAGGIPIEGMTISYEGTGVIGVTNQITDSDGRAIGTGTAPATVASGWTVQAHFSGDNQYFDAHTIIKSYSTTKHGTYLGLNVIPISPPAGGIYRVEGILRDTVTSLPLESQTISFTADSPIIISDAVTAVDGKYLKSGLVAPATPGNYNIQAHYNGNELYLARSSILRTLTVS